MLSLLTAVVTYNRKELLLQNLRMQFNQTYKANYILIIDNNSSDGTYKFLEEKGVLTHPGVYYFNTGDNLGGAGGFEYATKKAMMFDCDLICLMDDDGRPSNENTFEEVINQVPYTERQNEIPIFINSMVIKNSSDLSFPYRSDITTIYDAEKCADNHFLKGYASPYNGTFINKKTIHLIGYPRGDFFIRYDDTDFFRRAKKANCYMGVATKSLYYHPNETKYNYKKILGFTFTNDFESPWKEYYKFRNLQVMQMNEGDSRLKLELRYIYRLITMQLFTVNEKKVVKQFTRKAHHDALTNNMGRVIEPGQLTL